MTETKRLTNEHIKALANASGPCITVVLPEGSTPDLRIRRKEALNAIRKQVNGRMTDELLAPVISAMDSAAHGAGSVVVLRSSDHFEQFHTTARMPEMLSVGETFDFRPIVSALNNRRSFYILALSQKRTRLLHCTESLSQEVPFPEGVATGLNDFMQTRKPDHVLDGRSAAGPGVGHMKGVMFGTSSDADSSSEYILHFLQSIDKAIHSLLRESGDPLVTVGVEHELATYRRVNSYPNLVEPGIHGSPDGLEGGQMHKRALELLSTNLDKPMKELIDGFDKRVGTGHASTHVQDIVKGAYEGRVSHLFFQEGAHFAGTYDEVRGKVKRHAGEVQDLVDEAVYQTLCHGGDAMVLPASKMPNGVDICAIFRYPAPVMAMASASTEIA